MSVVHDSTADYSTRTYEGSSYRFSKLYPTSGSTGNAVTLTTAPAMVTWEIPADAFNPSESNLCFSALAGAGTAATINNIFRDTIGIDSIVWRTLGGTKLMEITNFAQFLKCTLKQETPFEEYVKNDETDLLHRCNAALLEDGAILRSTALNASSYAFVGAADPLAVGYSASGTAAVDNARIVFNSSNKGYRYNYSTLDATRGIDNAYTENAYLKIGDWTGNIAAYGATASPRINYVIPFKSIKNTIMALDKTIALGALTYIDVTFSAAVKWGFQTTAVLSPGTIGAITVSALAGNIAVSNLSISLAKEKNKKIADSVKEMIRPSGPGLKIPIDFAVVTKTSIAGDGTHVASKRYNKADGRILKKIFHSFGNYDETKNTRYDISNIDGSKVSSYRTQLDGEPLQDYDVKCSATVFDDWELQKNYVRGSVIQSSNHFRYNFAHIEHFSKFEGKDSVLLMDGLPLYKMGENGTEVGVEYRYDVYANVPVGLAGTGLNHYQFGIVSRDLFVQGDIISCQ